MAGRGTDIQLGGNIDFRTQDELSAMEEGPERHAALKQWSGRKVVDDLAAQGIMIRSPSARGVAEEAPGAYKDVGAVVAAAEQAGLARRVAQLRPLICIKG